MMLVILIPAFVIGLFGLSLTVKSINGMVIGRLDFGYGLSLHGPMVLIPGVFFLLLGLVVTSACSWLIWWCFTAT